MVIVRNALVSDAEAILAFCQQVGSETDNLSYGGEGLSVSVADEGMFLGEIQKSKTSHFLVAEEAGKIVGSCNCSAFRKKTIGTSCRSWSCDEKSLLESRNWASIANAIDCGGATIRLKSPLA